MNANIDKRFAAMDKHFTTVQVDGHRDVRGPRHHHLGRPALVIITPGSAEPRSLLGNPEGGGVAHATPHRPRQPRRPATAGGPFPAPQKNEGKEKR